MRIELLGRQISQKSEQLAKIQKKEKVIVGGAIIGIGAYVTSLTVANVNPELSSWLLLASGAAEVGLVADGVSTTLKRLSKKWEVEDLIRQQLKNIAIISNNYLKVLNTHDSEFLIEIMRNVRHLHEDSKTVGRSEEVISDFFANFANFK